MTAGTPAHAPTRTERPAIIDDSPPRERKPGANPAAGTGNIEAFGATGDPSDRGASSKQRGLAVEASLDRTDLASGGTPAIEERAKGNWRCD